MFLTVFATIRGNVEGWTSAEIVGCYVGAVVLLVAFTSIEVRRKFPMFDLTAVQEPDLHRLLGVGVHGLLRLPGADLLSDRVVPVDPRLFRDRHGNPDARLHRRRARDGSIAGKATESVSPRLVLGLSLGLVAVGCVTMTFVTPSDSWTSIIPGLVLTGAGLGLVGPTLASTAVGVVPSWRGGMASGMNATMREAGTTVGIAVLGVVLQQQITTHVQNSLSGGPLARAGSAIASAISAGGTAKLVAQQPANVRPGLQHVARVAYTEGLKSVFLFAAIVAAVGCVTAVALVRRKHMRAGAVAGH